MSLTKKIGFLCEEKYLTYLSGVIEYLEQKKIAEVHIFRPENIGLEESCIASMNLLVTVHSFTKSVIEHCLKLRDVVPTLTVQDGIIEYRSSKHRFQGNFRYRPLCTDYIAAFGERSKRLLMAAGTSENRIFVTGSPRFDLYFEKKEVRKELKPYLLLTMANRPAYGAENLTKFYLLFNDLISYLNRENIAYKIRLSRGVSVGGMEHVEKVRDLLPEQILSIFRDTKASSSSLVEDFNSCTAVITTPSTVSLEAMAYGIPVCHLLADPETVYLSTSWSIRTKHDIQRVVTELIKPPPMKMEYQNLILEENLVADSGSTQRVCSLIEFLLNKKD